MDHKKGPLYGIVALNLLGLTLKPQDKGAICLGPKPQRKGPLALFSFVAHRGLTSLRRSINKKSRIKLQWSNQ